MVAEQIVVEAVRRRRQRRRRGDGAAQCRGKGYRAKGPRSPARPEARRTPRRDSPGRPRGRRRSRRRRRACRPPRRPSGSSPSARAPRPPPPRRPAAPCRSAAGSAVPPSRCSAETPRRLRRSRPLGAPCRCRCSCRRERSRSVWRRVRSVRSVRCRLGSGHGVWPCRSRTSTGSCVVAWQAKRRHDAWATGSSEPAEASVSRSHGCLAERMMAAR